MDWREWTGGLLILVSGFFIVTGNKGRTT